MLEIALAKLLLQVSCGAPSFLDLLIQAARSFWGGVVTLSCNSTDIFYFPSGNKGFNFGEVKEHCPYFTILDVVFSDLGPSNL
jgi:hypothetical protein